MRGINKWTKTEAKGETLIVAFSASQGEPEWAGLLAKLSGDQKLEKEVLYGPPFDQF